MPPDFMSLSGQPEGRGDGGLRLSRDRGVWLTGGLLIAIAALAWVAVVRHGMGRQGTPPAQLETGMVGMSQANVASPVDATAYLVAWGVMMAAMMLPSATPMIALYGAISRNSSHSGQKGASTILFALVYLAAWLAIGLPVYAASRLVDWAAVMYPAVGGLFPYAVAAVLLAAGAFQFSPLKQACLRVCQSPLGFLMGHWRAGYAGTLKMAWEHAAYCAGCCWGLMVVLVAAGAMSLPWVLLIAVLVFAEKLLPYGQWTARIAGGALIGLALLVVARPDLAALLRGPAM
jgi:predicted metal-binding membrane protein